MRQAIGGFALLAGFLLLACVGASAQANSELTGIVTDQTGAVVPGARILLINPATNAVRSSVTSGGGLYDIAGLNPGTYRLRVTAKGFKTFEKTGIVVNVSETVSSNLKLRVGAENQTVVVAANALAVQADSNVVSTLINSQQISELATENRNLVSLVALGLGVSSDLPDNNTPTAVAANFNISVNGLRRDHNLFLIDGGESDDRGGGGSTASMPSQDAIAEFLVLASNYPPDYGISSGATISMSIKSGTQKFHGEVYEENRNTDYDANQYFNKLSTPFVPRTATHYNIFGANLGGPLEIPHLYNTDRRRTFFFWNEEWRKIVQGAGTNSEPTLDPADVPTAGQDLTYVSPKFAQIQLVVPTVGDPGFNAKLRALNLTPGQPFPNNTIPHQLFDPNAVSYLNLGILPKPNTPSGFAISNPSAPLNARDDIVRIDHKFNDKWQIMSHFIHDSVLQSYSSPDIGWSSANYNTVTSMLNSPSASAAIKLTGAISPNLLVEVGMFYDSNKLEMTNGPLSNKPRGWSVASFFNNGNSYLPGITGFGPPYGTNMDMGSVPWRNAGGDYQPRFDISYSHGQHAMKFGFSYMRYIKNQKIGGDAEGDFSFGSLSNDGIMDMLMGLASSYSQLQNAWTGHYVNQTPSVYAMDNWHVTPRLSLQLGLRYDALPLAWERSNRAANFYPSQYLSSEIPVWNSDGSMDPNGPGFQVVNGVPYYLNGIGIAGQNGVPRAMVNSDYRTLQPRFGFSEDLLGNGKTVLRGGFGIFYERITGNEVTNPATNPPFAFQPASSNVYFSSPSTSWVTGQTAATPFFPASMTTVAQPERSPGVAQFSLGVQHELAPSVVWVVQYVGNLSWHQESQTQINNFPLTTGNAIRCDYGDPSNHFSGDTCGSSLANANIYRTFQGYGSITPEEENTNSNYNGFQTGLRMQNRWGLSGEFDYTWSHEIDLTSSTYITIDNPWNPKYDKGSGLFDRRQIFNASYVYKLPFSARSNRVLRSAAGGWELAGTIIDETGLPSAPALNIGYDPVGLGGGYSNRPNESGKTHYPKKFGQWFDTSQFSAPVPGWAGGANLGFGNSGKDSVVTPGRVNFTTSLYKSFAVGEESKLELRVESFNTFNHTEFNTVSTTLGSGNFGQVTSAWDARVLQLGGKFVF